ATRRQGRIRGAGDKTLRDASSRATKAFYPALSLCDLIFSGVFERHPRLTLAIVEFELAWAPHLLSTMDYTYRQRHGEANYASRPARASSATLHGERRDADDRRVSTQHQQIGDNSDGPAPEPDLTRDEPVPPCRDGGEWNNRGLPGKWLPGGGTQGPSALCIDRHGASEGYDCPSREKEERR